MVKSSLDQLAQTEDIKIIWKSFELRPQGLSMPPAQEHAYKERVANAWPQTKQTAKEVFGVGMEYHRWGIKTRLAHEGAKFAEAQGYGEAYHEAMFKAHFIEDRDFGNLEILADLAEEIGLNRDEFIHVIESGVYAEQVDQDIAQARAYGLSGVPAAIIEKKYLVSGGQPLVAWQDIVKQIKEKEGTDN
jgi:predicted DsbA family dithiol-disulfide isomerase